MGLGTRQANGLEVLFQISSKVTYAAFDAAITGEPAIFKVISNDVVAGDTVSLVLADGSTLAGDALLISDMNCQVTKVNSSGSTVLITEFGLFR